MLAQRQPPFEQCVTADWSSDPAPKMIGSQAVRRSSGIERLVGERPAGVEAEGQPTVDPPEAIMRT